MYTSSFLGCTEWRSGSPCSLPPRIVGVDVSPRSDRARELSKSADYQFEERSPGYLVQEVGSGLLLSSESATATEWSLWRRGRGSGSAGRLAPDDALLAVCDGRRDGNTQMATCKRSFAMPTVEVDYYFHARGAIPNAADMERMDASIAETLDRWRCQDRE